MLHPSLVKRPSLAYAIGQRQLENGVEWVVIGVTTENGHTIPNRVKAGSFAHHILAEKESRLLPVTGVIKVGTE